MSHLPFASEFFEYLVSNAGSETNPERLPSLNDLSKELGVSVSSLREQMEVARALGLVEARPRTGIHRLPYSFSPAVIQSLSYAIAINPNYFDIFADVRVHIEIAYWNEAVRLLTLDDKTYLRSLVDRAWAKLRGSPIQIPQLEHREFHLRIYQQLKNPFVIGILEAYWAAYESVGLNVYVDYDYHKTVWQYHEQMIENICSGDFDKGYIALVEHTDLIYHRPIEEPDLVNEHTQNVIS